MTSFLSRAALQCQFMGAWAGSASSSVSAPSEDLYSFSLPAVLIPGDDHDLDRLATKTGRVNCATTSNNPSVAERINVRDNRNKEEGAPPTLLTTDSDADEQKLRLSISISIPQRNVYCCKHIITQRIISCLQLQQDFHSPCIPSWAHRSRPPPPHPPPCPQRILNTHEHI
ncbi:unnamed protein product [Amoebophrya sp. A25]|nr:unnamed protein product [Amoebophrya sp. A25]|eukprot:GSA25T00019632001.1